VKPGSRGRHHINLQMTVVHCKRLAYIITDPHNRKGVKFGHSRLTRAPRRGAMTEIPNREEVHVDR